MSEPKKRGRPIEGKGRPLTRTFRVSLEFDEALTQMAARETKPGAIVTRTDVLERAVRELYQRQTP